MSAVYVGRLYMIQLENEEPLEVRGCAIGVDADAGLVQADNARDLSRGRYWKRPKNRRSKRCVRLWYTRKREEFPEDFQWFHDLDDARAVVTLDKRKDAHEGQSVAFLEGRDVYECPQSGNFLCG